MVRISDPKMMKCKIVFVSFFVLILSQLVFTFSRTFLKDFMETMQKQTIKTSVLKRNTVEANSSQGILLQIITWDKPAA